MSPIWEVEKKIEKLGISQWLFIQERERILELNIDEDVLKDISPMGDTLCLRLDGCYVIKSDLPKEVASAQVIHDRYKDLKYVEQGFRICKTDFLEIRPIHVRTQKHTRGHAFVVMLAYKIVHHLRKVWAELDTTVEEAIRQLDRLCATHILIKGKYKLQKIPKPSDFSNRLLKAANIQIPELLPVKEIKVATRHKLHKRRL